MTQEEINDKVRCERDGNHRTDHIIEYDVAIFASDMAVLVRMEGDEVWLPYSHIVSWTPECAEMEISGWIAEQTGLI